MFFDFLKTLKQIKRRVLALKLLLKTLLKTLEKVKKIALQNLGRNGPPRPINMGV